MSIGEERSATFRLNGTIHAVFICAADTIILMQVLHIFRDGFKLTAEAKYSIFAVKSNVINYTTITFKISAIPGIGIKNQLRLPAH